MLPARKNLSYTATAMPERYQPKRRENPRRAVSNKTVRIQKYAQILLIIVVVSLAVSVIAHYTAIIGVNYQINRAQKELNASIIEGKALRLEVATLGSLERIESIAKNELGLVYPDSSQFIFLSLRN